MPAVFSYSKNLYTLLRFLQTGETAVYATIVETEGSSPQVPGASALFSEDGLAAGTVGGGILEARVEDLAKEAMKEKRSMLVSFDLGGELEGDAVCGGRVRILIDARPDKAVLEEVVESLRKRENGVLASMIRKKGEDVIIEKFWIPQSGMKGPYTGKIRNVEKVLSQMDLSSFPVFSAMEQEASDEWVYVERFSPLPVLVIAGAGHVGRAVAHLGNLLDFEVTVMDDRPEYACPDQIPEADRYIVQSIPGAIAELTIDAETYILIATRGHKDDMETLRACIKKPASYIGMMGSKRKIALMKSRFLKEGWASAEEWDRIHTPVGLPIHSTTVQEIAVSIAAQLVKIRNERTGKVKP